MTSQGNEGEGAEEGRARQGQAAGLSEAGSSRGRTGRQNEPQNRDTQTGEGPNWVRAISGPIHGASTGVLDPRSVRGLATFQVGRWEAQNYY